MSGSPHCNPNCKSISRKNSNTDNTNRHTRNSGNYHSAPVSSAASCVCSPTGSATGSFNIFSTFGGFTTGGTCENVKEAAAYNATLQPQTDQRSLLLPTPAPAPPSSVRNRSRSRNRQFRLLSAPPSFSPIATSTQVPSSRCKVVVPSRINSDMSMFSSHTILTKSSKSVRSEQSDYNTLLRPATPPPPPTPQKQPQQSQQSQQCQQCQRCQKSQQSKQAQQSQQTQQSQQQELQKHLQQQLESHVTALSTPKEPCVTPSREQQAEPVRPPSNQCTGTCRFQAHDINFLRGRLQKYRNEMESCGDAAKINNQLNEIFLQRLFDIECQADGDADTKLITYQEWVDMLLQINEVIINNMEDLESEVADRLDMMKQRIKASNKTACNDNDKYRSDICFLMQLLQNAYHNDDWNLEGMEFQTVNPSLILNNSNGQNSQTRNSSASNQLPPTFNNTEQMESRSRCTSARDSERVLQNHTFEQTPPTSICGCFTFKQDNDPKWSVNPLCDNSDGKDTQYFDKTQDNKDNQFTARCRSSVSSPKQQRPRRDSSYSISRDERPSSCLENIDLMQDPCPQVSSPPPPYNVNISRDQRQSYFECPTNCQQDEPPQYLENINLMKENRRRENSAASNCFTCFTRQDSFCSQDTTPVSSHPAPICVTGGSSTTMNNLSDYNLDTSQCAPKKTNLSPNNNANLRALAVEVAAKHDEIGDLKRQICSLEDEIQKAQQKITLKDNVIKELRNDLKSNKLKLSGKSAEVCVCSSSGLSMPPINLDAPQSSRSASTQVDDSPNQMYNDDCSPYDSLSNADHVEQQKLKALETELNELFEVTKDFKRQNLEFHRKRLSDIFQKSEAEKAEAYRKLDFIRRQLIDLEASGGEPCKCYTNDSDSGFSSKCETDQDAKILNAVRKRLRRLTESIFELKKCVQQLQIENNELSTCLSTEKAFAQRNSNALKELADMLCGITGSQFSYDDIYSTSSEEEMNPFCKAIIQMKRDFEDADRKLRNALGKKCNQVEELKQQAMHNQENLKQIQGDTKLNDNLRCQVEQLQCSLVDKEQTILQLNDMLEQFRCEQQQQQRGKDNYLQLKDKELREMRQKLEQANSRVETLMHDLDNNQKQERFLICETRKLNDELNESKRKHSDLSTQVHRLNTLLKSQDSCRNDISKKYEELERSYEDQAKQLRGACAQLNCLQERLVLMDKRHEEHNMERNLLRDEVLALKEKEAALLSKQKCLSEKLAKTEKELFSAHDVMKEQQSIMQRNEGSQKDCTKRLQDANSEMKRRFNALCDDYKRLEDEYKKQCELRKQNEKVIESFRKWKEAQLKADDATRASFKQYEEHIKMLLEEKQKFLEQYRSLHRDYCTLQHELERIKMCTYSFNTSGLDSNVSENSIKQRIESIRRASVRLSQRSISLGCDNTSQGASVPRIP